MKHILLIPNIEKDPNYAVTLAAIAVLRNAGAVLYADDMHISALGCHGVQSISCASGIPHAIEGIVVFGGDGSILHAAEIAINADIPLLGVNMGRLGYLADLEVKNIEDLARLVFDDYETRCVHALRFAIDGKPQDMLAINEITVSRGPLPYIADIELVAESGSISYRADGLIIATPTGSTAYSLSAGGPVIDADLDLMTVTPICPHSFFARSIVFSADSPLSVYNRSIRNGELTITVDGRDASVLPADSCLTIEKARTPLKILSLKKRRFLNVLKEKMCL